MIDYVKAEVYGCNFTDWLDIEYLDFKGTHSTKTGLIESKNVAKYNNLTFTIYDSGLMVVSGSLHKYYNRLQNIKAPNQHTKEQIEKGFNGNDFNYTQLSYVLNDLRNKFNIDLNQSIIRNIEFGLNILHNFITEKILDYLMLHKGKLFYKPLSISYRELIHTQYFIKCYDKAHQYGMKGNIMRFELKFKKMKQVNDIGIIYLSDLTKRNLLDNAKDELLNRWNEILIYDYTIAESQISEPEQILIMQFKNPIYWKGVKSNHLDRPKKKYYELEAKYSEQLKEKIDTLIKYQWKHLNIHCVTFDRLFKDKKNNCVTIDSSSIVSNLTQQQNNYNNTLNNIIITHYGI